MELGYVKFHRKSLEGGLIKNHRLWVFWTWTLLKASHKTRVQQVGFEEIEIDPGQFVTGRKAAAAELGMTERQVRTCIKSLSESGKIAVKTTNRFSIITVLKWNTYQGNGIADDQQATNKRPAGDQQATTNKNDENVENGKKTNTRAKRGGEDEPGKEGPPYEEIVNYLNKRTGKHFKCSTKATRDAIRARWIEGFRLSDFQRVIDTKTKGWAGTEFDKFIRPQTLFGNKFESYLNERPTNNTKKGIQDVSQEFTSTPDDQINW